jgi:protein-S-isoprenylcysteine O-methyltransferase Ste14
MTSREFFFKYRSYTPIPLILAALILARTTWWSLTLGLFIALSGEAVRLWALRYSGSATRTTGRVGADELVTNGPYGYLRNPLYLGNFLLSFGALLMAWPWMPWLLIIHLVLFWIQYYSIITLEEDFLRNKFGAVYAEYEAAVPRIIPRRTPWGKGDRVPTTLRKALRTERNSLQSLSAVTLLVIIIWILRS